jgi:hypothetical protein
MSGGSPSIHVVAGGSPSIHVVADRSPSIHVGAGGSPSIHVVRCGSRCSWPPTGEGDADPGAARPFCVRQALAAWARELIAELMLLGDSAMLERNKVLSIFPLKIGTPISTHLTMTSRRSSPASRASSVGVR